jgi:hypothetical protein
MNEFRNGATRLEALEQPSGSPAIAGMIRRLLAHCEASGWMGYDPYDALNSRLFEAIPLLNSRWPRLGLTQLMRRSPVNLRRLALIPKTENPKATGLFLRALVALPEKFVEEREPLIAYMIARLAALRSAGCDRFCWGYSFPWQGRTIFVPAGAPNVVCTAFVADALLDACEWRQNEACFEMAVSAGEYMVNDLYWNERGRVGFSYPVPGLRGETHNANLLAAAFLCRLYKLTGREDFLEPALLVARQAVRKQNADGSWFYGEAASQRWIDNFHTGYNLGALRSIGVSIETAEFEESVRRGYEFYQTHFLREDGAPKYFHDRVYPIDIHCVAQAILTLLEFKDLDPAGVQKAQAVLGWATKHMWDDKSGFFYYRVLRLGTIRTSYMRWSQAWMLVALAAALRANETKPAQHAAEPSLVSAT